MRCFCVVQKQKGVADAVIEALSGLDHGVGHPNSLCARHKPLSTGGKRRSWVRTHNSGDGQRGAWASEAALSHPSARSAHADDDIHACAGAAADDGV